MLPCAFADTTIMPTKGQSSKMPKKPSESRMSALEVAACYAEDFAATIDDLATTNAEQIARGLLTVGHESVARLVVNRLVGERVGKGVVPPIAEYMLMLSVDRRPRPQDVEESLVQLVSIAVRRHGHDRSDFAVRETIERLRVLRKGNLNANTD